MDRTNVLSCAEENQVQKLFALFLTKTGLRVAAQIGLKHLGTNCGALYGFVVAVAAAAAAAAAVPAAVGVCHWRGVCMLGVW